MKIVVTGGAGFIGSTIVRALFEQTAHSVRVLDDLSSGHEDNLAELRPYQDNGRLEFIEVDAGSAESGPLFNGIDGVIHCAAYADVSKNWQGNERNRQWEMNAELTRQVLEHSMRSRPRFLLLSTCSVYGPGTVSESTPTHATSPYAASKIAAEALVGSYDEAKRVRGTVFRLVNVVGPRYRHGHIADFVKSATVSGKVHALDDGIKKKSFVNVRDVADEAVAVMNGAREDRILNITSPYVWSWRDSIATMRAMRPTKPFTLTFEPRPSGWVGDPGELVVMSNPLRHADRRSIVEGVTEALVDLKW